MKQVKLLAALAAAVVVLLGIWMCFRPKGIEGTKDLDIQVIFEDESGSRPYRRRGWALWTVHHHSGRCNRR